MYETGARKQGRAGNKAHRTLQITTEPAGLEDTDASQEDGTDLARCTVGLDPTRLNLTSNTETNSVPGRWDRYIHIWEGNPSYRLLFKRVSAENLLVTRVMVAGGGADPKILCPWLL